MRVAVIGAGAVGGTLAALLDRAGHEVDVVARGSNLEAIDRDGVRLSGAFGDHVARVDAVERLRRRPELAIVATKAADSEGAMRPAARILGGVPVIVVQNGLGAIEAGRRALPDSEILGGLAVFAASFAGPGRIEVTTGGDLYLGTDAGSQGLALLFAERAFDGILPVTVVDDFVGAQWTKLVINQVNALPAITGLSVQEVVADPVLRRVLTASMREAVGVARATGVRFVPLQGLSNPTLLAFALAPARLAELLPLALARRLGATPNPGSTLQSIRRGQRTEVDHLNGAVVEAARAAGGEAPINEALTRLVHEVEGGGGFLTVDVVKERMPLRSR